MSGGSTRSNPEPLQILFGIGTAGSLTDAQLLDRFIQGPDDAAQAAFLALVERHGPIVQRVCRQILGDPHDAEDAAQATFLILARQSKSIRRRESVASWIFGVATRVSRCARVEAARRRHHERQRGAVTSDYDRPGPDSTEATPDDARTAVLEELERLPERLRAPLVACHLEGLTQEQAATRLRCSLRSLQRRLATGRERLRLRLTRRGFAPAFVAALAGLADRTRAAGISSETLPWANTTVAAAMAVAAGGTFAGTGVTPGAVRLARITMRSITLMKVMKLAISIVLLAGLAAVGLSTLANVANDPPPPPSAPRAAGEPSDEPAASELTLTVVDAATGKPVDGLPLGIGFGRSARSQPNLKKVTGAGGKASISIPKGESGNVMIDVHKDGYVPVELRWTVGPGRPLPSAYTLRLERGTAIGGRVVDPQGKPIAGATVLVWVPREDRRHRLPVVVDLFNVLYTTDAQGRWRCDVAPPDLETIRLSVEHPSHASGRFIVRQTDRDASSVTIKRLREQSAELTLNPGLAVAGSVFEKATGKPISGAILRLGTNLFGGNDPETKTDGEGRFTVNSAGPGPNTLTVQAAGHAPETIEITVRPDLELLTFRLGPGHTIRGRVLGPDAKPIPGAHVTVDNWRGKEILLLRTQADGEGRFALEDAPADAVEVQLSAEGSMNRPGVVMSPSADGRDYLLSRPLRVAGKVTDATTGKPIETFAVIPTSTAARPPSSFDRDDAKTFRDGRYAMEFVWPVPSERVFWFEAEGYRPATSRPIRYDEGSVTFDIALTTGVEPLREAVAGVIQLPDGTSAPGIAVYLATPSHGLYVQGGKPLYPDRVVATVTRRDGAFRFPRQTESGEVVVLDDRGFAQKSETELADSPTIKLAPWGRVEGVVMSNGEPVPFTEVSMDIRRLPESRSRLLYYSYRGPSDAHGHFAIDRVPPGKASIARGISIEPRSTHFGPWQAIDIEPGKTLTVTVGGTGRPVVGRLAIPNHLALDPKRPLARLELKPPPGPEIPEGLTIDERRAWFKRWSETEAGHTYVDWQKNRRGYPVVIDADGRFRSDDVLPGTYMLVIPMIDAESRDPIPGTELSPIEVPGTLDKAAHTTLDVGEIGPLKTKPKRD